MRTPRGQPAAWPGEWISGCGCLETSAARARKPAMRGEGGARRSPAATRESRVGRRPPAAAESGAVHPWSRCRISRRHWKAGRPRVKGWSPTGRTGPTTGPDPESAPKTGSPRRPDPRHARANTATGRRGRRPTSVGRPKWSLAQRARIEVLVRRLGVASGTRPRRTPSGPCPRVLRRTSRTPATRRCRRGASPATPEDPVERVVADLAAQRVQRQRALVVDRRELVARAHVVQLPRPERRSGRAGDRPRGTVVEVRALLRLRPQPLRVAREALVQADVRPRLAPTPSRRTTGARSRAPRRDSSAHDA